MFALLVLLVATVAVADEVAQHAAPLAVVMLHGFDSDPDIFRGSEPYLRDAGLLPVLVGWGPQQGQDAFATATDSLLPAIERELAAAGRAPDAPFAVVAHSMGGLMVRYLLEHARPELGQRVPALEMISTPNQGPHTGLGNHACAGYLDKAWRALGCALKPKSELITTLGTRPPEGLATRYLSIGVESFEPFIPLPAYDGDGDGVARGHDKVVMAEAAWLEGVPFVLWRAWGRRGDHFGSTCAEGVNRWAVDFIRDGILPSPSGRRVRATDLCDGLSKRAWRHARESAAAGREP
jgi:pimeloyl-ACP methyl ester carboxylesterase